MIEQSQFVDKLQILAQKERNPERIRAVELMSQVPEAAQELAAELAESTGRWNPVEIYTAKNFATENAKVVEAEMRGGKHNPKYNYEYAQSLQVDGMREKLQEIGDRARQLPRNTMPATLARLSLTNAIRADQATLDLILGLQRGDDRLVKNGVNKMYRPSGPELVNDTIQVLHSLMQNGRPQPSSHSRFSAEERMWLLDTKLNADEQAAAFRWGLEKYGMLNRSEDEGEDLSQGFQVQVDPSASTMDIRDRSKQGPVMVIPTAESERLTAAETCGLLAHEIGGHARQAMNGFRLFGAIGGGPSRKPCEWTYEGQAKWQEVQFWKQCMGDATPILEPYYAAIIAIQDAEQGCSFSQIVEHLTRLQLHIELKIPAGQPLPNTIDNKMRRQCIESAVSTTYLVMRGHNDTTNQEAFAMRKNSAYFGGYRLMEGLHQCNLSQFAEAAITSLPGLQTLAAFVDVRPEDLIPFKPDLAETYAKKLLADRKSV